VPPPDRCKLRAHIAHSTIAHIADQGMFTSLYRTRFASTKENICISAARLAHRVPLLATSQLRTFSQCRILICSINLHLSVSPCLACLKQTCSKDPHMRLLRACEAVTLIAGETALVHLSLPLPLLFPFPLLLGFSGHSNAKCPTFLQ
jgi:hypothetical protein